MVYCGRPSKGCAPCRAKRTKCDQARPSCGQCRRAHRECPGYRDVLDTVFRDETIRFEPKTKAVTVCENSEPVLPTPRVGQVRDDGVRNAVTDFSAAPAQMVERTTYDIQNLSVPLEDGATFYFFHNFVPEASNSRSFTNAYSHVLPTLCRQGSSFGVLPKVIDAIGLAGISNMKHSPELMLAAGQKYASVLRAINASIQDSREASTDQTLIAIMLLGLFETVTGSSPESIRSWTNHVNGATAIARLRGTGQLRTKIGRTIFAIVRLQVLINCLQRRLIVPPDFIEWAEIAAETETDETRSEHQLFLIIGRLCALRATVERPHNNSIGVITLANFIDSDLEDWKNGLPPAFSYSKVKSASAEYVFSGVYHVYNTTWAVGVLNLYRSARILTQQVITGWLSRESMPSSAPEELQRRQSKVLFASLAHDICASVPFILGASHTSMYSTRPLNATAGTGLLWPLYLAATMDQQVAGMRTWIGTRLEAVGQIMGIKQAESLANVLKTRREITAWDKFEAVRADEVHDHW